MQQTGAVQQRAGWQRACCCFINHQPRSQRSKASWRCVKPRDRSWCLSSIKEPSLRSMVHDVHLRDGSLVDDEAPASVSGLHTAPALHLKACWQAFSQSVSTSSKVCTAVLNCCISHRSSFSRPSWQHPAARLALVCPMKPLLYSKTQHAAMIKHSQG